MKKYIYDLKTNYSSISHLLLLSIILFLWISIFLSSCSSSYLEQGTNTLSQKNRDNVPVWVTSPNDNEVCPQEKYFCASSSGKTISGADQASRAELANYFKTKIKSSLNSSELTKEINDSVKGNLESKMEENYSATLSSLTDEIIEGSVIKERFVGNAAEYYSLSAINRQKFTDQQKLRVADVEREIDDLLKNGSRMALFKVKDLYYRRVSLIQMLSLMELDNQSQSSSLLINEKYWRKNVSEKLMSPQKVFLEITTSNDEKFWEDKFISIISQSGHKIVNNKNQARFLVKLRLKLNKGVTQKIEGFISARLEINVISFDLLNSMQVEGSFQQNSDINGRSEEQIWNRGQDLFESILFKNIHLLGI